MRRQNHIETARRRRVAFMTVQTGESSAAAEMCSVTVCCHAVLMVDTDR